MFFWRQCPVPATLGIAAPALPGEQQKRMSCCVWGGRSALRGDRTAVYASLLAQGVIFRGSRGRLSSSCCWFVFWLLWRYCSEKEQNSLPVWGVSVEKRNTSFSGTPVCYLSPQPEILKLLSLFSIAESSEMRRCQVSLTICIITANYLSNCTEWCTFCSFSLSLWHIVAWRYHTCFSGLQVLLFLESHVFFPLSTRFAFSFLWEVPLQSSLHLWTERLLKTGQRQVLCIDKYHFFIHRQGNTEGKRETGNRAGCCPLHQRGPAETHRDPRPGPEQRPGQGGETGGGGKNAEREESG